MTASLPRFTIRLAKVMDAIVTTPGSSGADVIRATGMPSGTVYPMLTLLERTGLVGIERERGDPVVLGRPIRWFYRVTPVGRDWIRDEARSILPMFGRIAAD